MTQITAALQENYVCIYIYICYLFLTRMKNVSDKVVTVVEKVKTHILCSRTSSRFPLPRKTCRLLDNMEKYGRTEQAKYDNIIRRMRCAYWITKASNIHSEYVILIPFPLQQSLRERSSILRFYLHCPSCFILRNRSL